MFDLRNARVAAAAASAAALLALAPSALASGGVNSGGVNSGGVNGGGGGTPAPAPGSCTITSFSNSTGYYSVWAAIWTKFSISSSCGAGVSWQMTYTNGNTGNVDFARSTLVGYMPSGTIDEDWAAFSTPYTVTLTVNDSSGAQLDSQSAVVTTKAPKSGTGL
jgi:hypothetical protein